MIEVCIRLTNIRARLVGVSQIRNVFVPIWRDSDEANIWDNFEKMLFDDIERADRVSRFHIQLNRIG